MSNDFAGVRVLVVDDEPPNIMDLLLALHRRGFIVASSADGAESLAMARTFRPHVLIVDAAVPESGRPVVAASSALRRRRCVRAFPHGPRQDGHRRVQDRHRTAAHPNTWQLTRRPLSKKGSPLIEAEAAALRHRSIVFSQIIHICA
ncbi:hypothetical protein [Nocardia sp. CA-119907]|uniref:hypothetical protein n=1 Tax=Nocardia sp. CA-119907 TaxID=3239973 RepID=UPI003D9551A3